MADANTQTQEAVEVREAELPEAAEGRVNAAGGQLDILLDTTMEISVRLGQMKMTARELIQLGAGSVVTLDKAAGEPVELLLRGIRFATGRLVVVGDRLGVRVEEILPAAKEVAGE